MGVVEALVPLLLSLGKIAADYALADAVQRAALLAQADEDYAKCKSIILGLAEKVAANDKAADAIADAKPSSEEITRP